MQRRRAVSVSCFSAAASTGARNQRRTHHWLVTSAARCPVLLGASAMTTLGRCLSSCSVLTESCSATNCVSTNAPSDSWWARSPSRAAEFFHVSWRTATKWAQRYREEGPAGMSDRSSARLTQHAKTPDPSGPRDRAPTVEAAVGAGPDRCESERAGLYRARRTGPVPVEPAVPHRPGHRRTGSPLGNVSAPES
jgi:hypothetical protein